MNLPLYSTWTKNRTEKGGGGISTSVSLLYSDSSVGVGEGRGEDEYLVTRIECFQPALNLINCYGEQRKSSKQEVELKWSRLKAEMEAIRNRGEFCLLAGDLNKLVGNDEWGVPGNHPEVSLGGRLLRELLATRDWTLVNGLGEEVVQGGPYTRSDPATGNRSCLDLFVASRELMPYVTNLSIDSERKNTIARIVKNKRKRRIIYPDHFSSILTFKNLPRKREEKNEKRIVWNLAKENGWQIYKSLTDKYSEKLENIIGNEGISIEETMIKFNKIHNKIKFTAFGKVSIGKLKHIDKENEETGSDKENVDKLFIEQNQLIDKEIEEIKKGSGKVGRVWEIKKKISGGKKDTKMMMSAVLNPKTNKLAISKKDIKKFL